MLDPLRLDLRHSARSLVRSPVFTLTAILSIAIGIGAVTAIYSLVDTLLLRPAPGIGAPDRLVDVGRSQEGEGHDNVSYLNYADYRDRTTTLAGLAALEFTPRAISLAGPEGGEAVEASIVSGNFFEVLQARPALGRFFLPEEDRVPRANPVVVLSHRFWSERFGGDAAIVGRTLVLNGSPFTVVGVAAERFNGPRITAPDLWAPIMASPLIGGSEGTLRGRQFVWLNMIGRLAPDVSMDAAQAELSGIARQLQEAYPETNRGQGVSVMATGLLPGDFRGMLGAFMSLLLAVAGLVLLIASTNVAGMLLARAAGRRREIAVRLALGASRRRLLRQLVTESLLLFVAAGLAGFLLARVLVAGIVLLLPRVPTQLAFEPVLDWRVFLVALGVALIAGVLAGLAPGLQSTRPALVPSLKAGGGGGGHRQRLRSALLVTQMAFSMLLLVTAGLFARALVHARSIDPGFDPRNVQLASLDMGLTNYTAARGQQFALSLLERARELPGVQSVALSASLPLAGGGLGLGGIDVAGRTPPDPRRGWDADWNVITPDYFDVMRMSLVGGRAFTEADREGTPDVAIINQTLAGRLWPGEDPIGRTFRNEDRTVTVVGVARDAKYRTLGEGPRAFVYVPLAQRWFARASLLVRTAPDAQVAGAIRRLVAELEPSLPVLDQQPLAEYTSIGLLPQRVALWVAGTLGGVALLLALLGIYGVTAYTVTQRTREIGIRMALGAERARVLGLVLRQGVLLAGFGILAGTTVAFGVTRLMRALLFGLPSTDVIAFGGAALLLLAAALLASLVPARRAAGVEPSVALRTE